MPAADVWRALAARGELKKHSTGWLTKCPAHADSKSSLSVRKNDSGDMLIYCQGGCETKMVITALGFGMTDLFRDELKRKKSSVISATYDYVDEDGEVLYQSVRMEPKDFRVRAPDGNGGWKWGIGDDVRRILYRLPEMIEAPSYDPVFICEGEKDCDNLRKLGVAAVAIQGGAGAWRQCYASQIGTRRAIVLPDNDKPGMKFAMDVASTMRLAMIVNLWKPSDKHGADVTDWMSSGKGKNELFQACLDASENHAVIAENNFKYWRTK